MTLPARGWIVMLLVLAALAACGGRKVMKPRTPDVPQTGDASARSRFAEARAKFLRDGKNAQEFKAIIEEYPDDPIVPWAQLYAGIADVNARRFDTAATVLEEVVKADVPEALAQRAQLYLGITKNYLGDAAAALPLLAKGAKAIENDAERTEYLAAVAYATAVVEPVRSLGYFDQLYARVTPTERALIVTRVEEIVAAADPNALRKAFDDLDDRKGPAMAAVASRLVIVAERAGNTAEAQRLREAAAPARAAVGLPRTIAVTGAVGGSGTAGLVGAVIPAKTKAADAAIAGLGLAAGAAGGAGVAAIEVRSANDAAAAAVAVEDLSKQNVIAIIGPIDGAAVDAAASRAEGLGVPLLSLATRPEERTTGKFVFHMRHSAESRARWLARRALAMGVKTFAMLAPQDKYGEAVGQAFVDEVGKGGGTIVSRASYPAGTKSFPSFASKLGGSWEALFVPEEAETLALIAPAVSATGRIPKPHGTKRTPGGRPILLMSTAEGLTGAFVANAGRHAEGALFAPGYYPDDRDPAQKAFVDRFLAQYGRAPGVNEAYAYDAAQLAAAAGTGGRSGLAASLAGGTLQGLTGAIKFDQDHRRADPGVTYTVIEDGGAFTIRVKP